MIVMEPIYWLIALALLLFIEIITLGLTTIWFAGGALVAFVASMLGASSGIQFILFLSVSFVLLFFTRPVATKYFNKDRVKTNVDSLVGCEGKVTVQIDNFNQAGVVILNGQEWSARSENDQIIEVGTKVRVIRITGVKLIVTDQKGEL